MAGVEFFGLQPGPFMDDLLTTQQVGRLALDFLHICMYITPEME